MIGSPQIREDFPILRRHVRGKELIYLDSAATTLKPKAVIDTVNMFNSYGTSNVHRGVHFLSEEATQAYENSRREVTRFINAKSEKEVVFTSGTTMAINLVAQSYGREFLEAGDEIIVSQMEHHSNIVPWQLLCSQIGCHLKVIPMNDRGELEMDAYRKLLSEKTKIVSVVYVSNALGTINPVREIIQLAHKAGAVCMLDGAQAVAHMPVDVQELNCDFFAFSGHKLFAENGIGVLYGRERLLEKMPPFLGGGDMIRSVSFEKTTYAELPMKFEAGTPHISGALSLTPAIKMIEAIGLDKIGELEDQLLRYGTEKLASIEGVRLIGTAAKKASILSFVVEDIHPHDLGTLVDAEGIAIRTGHHCAQPVMTRLNLPATARASLSIYNTSDEIDQLALALIKAKKVFA